MLEGCLFGKLVRGLDVTGFDVLLEFHSLDALAGLVVTIGCGADETVIGGASYVGHSEANGAKVAEVAFTIEEDFHGQGLASRLLAALATLARRHGLVRFEAEVLAANAPMLAVFQRSGLPLRRRSEGGVIHLDLAPPPG